MPLILDQNIRNTRQIASTFQPLVGHQMRFLGGDGPQARFVPASVEDAFDVGDDEVDRLLDEGWRPEDVALLTTGSRHPEQIARQAEGIDAYWDSFWDADQVFYGHVLGFKGLERRAVVLVVNDRRSLDRARERLYVGLSRPVTNWWYAGIRRSSANTAGRRWPGGWGSPSAGMTAGLPAGSDRRGTDRTRSTAALGRSGPRSRLLLPGWGRPPASLCRTAGAARTGAVGRSGLLRWRRRLVRRDLADKVLDRCGVGVNLLRADPDAGLA